MENAYSEVFPFRVFMLLKATVIIDGKRLCVQVDFTCVIIAHLSQHIMFGSFSHSCNMNNPHKPDQKQSLAVLLTVFSAKVIFELMTSWSSGQDEGLPFFPDVRSRKIECFAWGYVPNFLCSWGILLIAGAVSEVKDYLTASLKGFLLWTNSWARMWHFARCWGLKLPHWLTLLSVNLEIHYTYVVTSLLLTLELQNNIVL